jgi:hypothetical protein
MQKSKYLGFLMVAAIALTAMSCAKTESPAAVAPVEIAYSSLPLAEGELPPGPGRDEVLISCMSCHSPAYITMQPRFSRKVWEGVVTKMIDTFGAQVRPYDQKLIADYLVSIRGIDEKATEQ